MKATWRRVGVKAEAELRTRDERSELLQAFLRVGPQWYVRQAEDAEWEKCAPSAVPVRVADLLRGV